MFHGAAHVQALAHVLDIEPDEALGLCRQLVAVGLADAKGPYLLPNPALGRAVADELSDEERRGLERRWLRAILELIDFLYEEQFHDAKVANQGTQAALGEFLVALEKAERYVETGELLPDIVMRSILLLRQLVLRIGRPAVLARLDGMSQRLKRQLEDWSQARFHAAVGEIEEKLAKGNVGGALETAARLRQRAEAAGNAYSGYDKAVACLMLGRVLKEAGRAAEALLHLDEAGKGFAELAKAGHQPAAGMFSAVLADRGDALRTLGRFAEAAESHERGIEIDEKLGNRRSAAAGRLQVGIVRFHQRRLRDALKAFEKARKAFEVLQEPDAVAAAWLQIGRVCQEAGECDRSEAAYQRSLRIQVDQGNKGGQASTLDQLGILYQSSGALEEAAQFHRQAATISEELDNADSHARSLCNLAVALLGLGRLGEARDQATRAARLAAPMGHAANPWKTWGLLHQIEIQAHCPEAAEAARVRAIELYRTYRRDGGEPLSSVAELIDAVAHLLREHRTEEARRFVQPPEQFNEALLPVRDALFAIIDGSRDPAAAQDALLNYELVVEFALLLDSLPDG